MALSASQWGVGQTTPEREALFGTIYWAALRPEESLNLLETEYQRPKEKEGVGKLHLTGALSEAGAARTDWPDPRQPPWTGRDLRRCERPAGYPQRHQHRLAIRRERLHSPAELASPLARRPYELRAACVSYWLSRGISPALVARWAGHSVKVLLEVYASWIFGEEAAVMVRIEEGFEDFPDTAELAA